MPTPGIQRDRAFLLLGLRIAGEFGATIAVPVVVLALTGRWLDGRYGTAPRLLILGFVLAAVISAVAVNRQAKRFGKEFQSLEKQQDRKR